MCHFIKKHSLYILCALFIYSSTYAMYSRGDVGGSLISRLGSVQLSPFQTLSSAPLPTSGLTAFKKRRIEKNLTTLRAFENLPRELLGKILSYLSASALATLLQTNPSTRNQIRKLLMDPLLKKESLRRVLGEKTATQRIKNVVMVRDLRMLLEKIIEYLLNPQAFGTDLHGILINTLERFIISHPREVLGRVSHIGVVELHSSINPGHQKVLNFIFGILHRLENNLKSDNLFFCDIMQCDVIQMVNLIKQGISLRNDLQGTAVTESKESRDEDYFFKALLNVNFELCASWIPQINKISVWVNALKINPIPPMYYSAHLLGAVRAQILILKNRLRIETEEVLEQLILLFKETEACSLVADILNRLENASLWIEILNRTKPHLESANAEMSRLAVEAIGWIVKNQPATFWKVEGGWVLAQGLLEPLQGLLADETSMSRDDTIRVIRVIRWIVKNQPATFWKVEGGLVLAQRLLNILQGLLENENLIARGDAVAVIVWIVQNLEAAFWRAEGGLVLAQRLLEPLQGLLADEHSYS